MINRIALELPSALLGAAVLVYLDARRRGFNLLRPGRKSTFVFLDMLGLAAACAYAVFQLASFLAGFPALMTGPIVEFLLSAGIFFYLWREGRRAIQFQRPDGIVLGEFLVLAGIARVLTHVAARERPIADVWSFGGVSVGALVIAWLVPRFLKKREEHHIIERINHQGEIQQPEYTPPTSECPHPERWTMVDSMSAEVEIPEFLQQLVLTVKPELIVETGTFLGASAIKMAEGLRANGFGKIITCESDPLVYAKAKERIATSGVEEWMECHNESSLGLRIDGMIDLFFSDSHLPIREDEIRRFLPQINPHGLILMHDVSSHYKVAREAAFRLEQEGLISMILLPTPRGLMMAQRRAGRR